MEVEGEEFNVVKDSACSLEDEQPNDKNENCQLVSEEQIISRNNSSNNNNGVEITQTESRQCTSKSQSNKTDYPVLPSNLPFQNNPASKDIVQIILNQNKIINQQSSPFPFSQNPLNSNTNTLQTQQSNQYLWQLIPKQVTKPEGVFFLKGNIGIDLNRYSASHVSFLNHYQQINTLTRGKNRSTLSLNFSADPKMYDSFQAAIQYLRYFPNKDCNELAEKLEIQEEYQNLEIRVKSKMKEITEQNPFMLKLANTKRREFEKFKKKKIASLSEDRYYGFVEYSFDYEDMSYKIVGGGVNELMAKLLGGCDLDSLQEIFLRSGVLEFLEAESKWKLLNETINNWRYYFNNETRYEFNTKLITLDDLVIQTDCVAQFFSSEENEIYQGYFHSQYEDLIFEKGLIIIENLMSDFHVKQINSIRQKYITENNLNQSEFGKKYFPFLISPILRDDSVGGQGNLQTLEQYPVNKENTQKGFNNSGKQSGSLNPLESKTAQTFETFYSNLTINSNSDIADKNNQEKDQYDRQNNSNNLSQPAGLSQYNFSEKINDLMTDIPHAVHASCFLEAFYNNKDQQKTAEQDMFPNRTCGYKHVLS